MKAIIAGGRSYRPTKEDWDFLDRVDRRYLIEEVVSGGAGGADHFGEEWARSRFIPVKVFRAEWDKFGKAAGPIRNRAMADHVGPGGLLVAFPGGRGTVDMIDTAVKRGINVIRAEEHGEGSFATFPLIPGRRGG